MTDPTRTRRAALLALLAAPLAALAAGCGGDSKPTVYATPNPEMNVDESGTPPEGKKAKPARKP